jgi:membrane protein implicated in regulation of membrane protease activity
MDTLILALVIPSVFIIIFGIILVGIQLEPGNLAYLLLLFALFTPAGVILLLIRKLRRIPEKQHNID